MQFLIKLIEGKVIPPKGSLKGRDLYSEQLNIDGLARRGLNACILVILSSMLPSGDNTHSWVIIKQPAIWRVVLLFISALWNFRNNAYDWLAKHAPCSKLLGVTFVFFALHFS